MNTTTQSNEKPAQPVVLPVDLRDYFAAKAMQGLMSREGQPEVEHETALAYRIADAMLKAREVQA